MSETCLNSPRRISFKADRNTFTKGFWGACDQARLGAASLDLDGHFLAVNKWLSKILGYSNKELLGRRIDEITRPATVRDDALDSERLLQGTSTHSNEMRVLRKDDQTVWINSHLTLARDPQTQELRGFTWIVEDISLRRRADKDLQRYSEINRELRNISTDVFITLDSDLRYTFWNRAAENLTGVSAVEAIGRRVGELFPGNPAIGVLEDNYSTVLQTQQNRAFITDILIGRSRHILDVSIHPFHDGISVCGRDITDERHASIAMRISEEKYAKLFKACPGIMLLSTMDGGIAVEINNEFERVTGYSRKEVIGKSIPDLNIWADGRERERLVRKLLNQGYLRDEESLYKTKHGRVFPALVSTELVDIEGTKSMLSVIVDITSIKRTDMELMRNEQIRKELSGRLITAHEEERRRIARELHDDIGQDIALLGVRIQRTATLDLQTDAQKVTMAELYKRVQDIAKKVTRLSHQLHSSELEYLGLTVGVESLCREFAAEHKLEIKCICDKISRVSDGTALCLYRVVQEALRNVSKHSSATQVEVSIRAESGYIDLEVGDNGIGFIVKDGESTNGMGLLSMRERMNQQRGELHVESAPGIGTKVRARVPVAFEKDEER